MTVEGNAIVRLFPFFAEISLYAPGCPDVYKRQPRHSQNGHLPLKHSIFLEEPKMKKYTVMKKFLTMTLACAMTLSLAACGSKTDTCLLYTSRCV